MLYALIQQAQRRDDSAVLQLVKQFDPLLRKYARLLKDEDAYEILLTDFVELLFKMDLSRIHNCSDAAFVCYMQHAISHQYIRYSKKRSSVCSHEICFSDLSDAQQRALEASHSAADVYDEIGHAQLNRILTPKEKKILLLTCVYGVSSAEIARKLHVSRQHINQIKQRAIKKAKKYYINMRF